MQPKTVVFVLSYPKSGRVRKYTDIRNNGTDIRNDHTDIRSNGTDYSP